MRHPLSRWGALALAAALALPPSPAQAVAPAVLLLLKQVVRQAASSMVQDALLSGLQGMGCKGIALSNALAAFDLRRSGGAAALVGMAVPNTGSLPGMVLPGGLPGALPNSGPAGGLPPDIAARMGAMSSTPAALPAGMGLDAEPTALLAGMLASMGRPLSAGETRAVLDELLEIGFLPRPVHADLNDCLRLVPASVAALSMGMGMLQPMLAPLREARDTLRGLTPAEQDEVADALAQELRPCRRASAPWWSTSSTPASSRRASRHR